METNDLTKKEVVKREQNENSSNSGLLWWIAIGVWINAVLMFYMTFMLLGF